MVIACQTIMVLKASAHRIVIEGGRHPLWDVVSWKDGSACDLLIREVRLYVWLGIEGVRKVPPLSYDNRPDVAMGKVFPNFLAPDETIEVACPRQKRRTLLTDTPVPEGFELTRAIVQRPDGIWQTDDVFIGQQPLKLLNGMA